MDYTADGYPAKASGFRDFSGPGAPEFADANSNAVDWEIQEVRFYKNGSKGLVPDLVIPGSDIANNPDTAPNCM